MNKAVKKNPREASQSSQRLSEKFSEKVRNSFPERFSNPRISTIDLVGTGVCLDVDGQRHKVNQLVVIFTTSIPGAVAIELQVHHDVWSTYAFDGMPQPGIREKNAPRLTEALKGLEKELRVEADPGEPTYFGTPIRYGIRDPRPEEIFDGIGPDVTDRI